MRVAVTGATGFVGGAIARRLAAAGHDVVALVRDPVTAAAALPGATVAACTLPDHLDDAVLAGVEVVVHAAWATTETDPTRADRVNEDGTRRLLAAARRAGARVVFVSSIAARPDAPSHYGRSKWAMEQLLDPARDAILRPGLVVGPGGRGLFQQLRQAAGRLHVVPVFGGGRQPLQTVHVDDVAEAAARVVADRLAGTFVVAEADAVALVDFLRLMTAEMDVRCLFVPLPLAPILAVLRGCERIGLRLPLRSESLLGMQGMQPVRVADSLARLGMAVRPARESLRACDLGPRGIA